MIAFRIKLRQTKETFILQHNFSYHVNTIICYIIRMENEPQEVKSEGLIYRPRPKDQSWWELVKFALIALVIVIPVRLYVAEPFVVSGSSMVPTFTDRDYLIINKISYHLGDPKRGDVVVFKYPNDPKNDPRRSLNERVFDPGKFFIKRIMALPGETIDIRGNDITITNENNPNGFKLDQPFVKNGDNNNVHLRLKSDEYYVMGDNRSASSDSRAWGPLQRSFITGKVMARLLPLSAIDIAPGKFTQLEN